MVYMSTRSYEQTLPIYRDGQLSLRAIAHFMGTTQESVASILDKDVRTVQRDLASKNVMKHLQPLVYALQMLSELTHNDQEEIKRWLHEPKIEWLGQSPLDCLEKGNINAVVNLISRIYYGDSAGY